MSGLKTSRKTHERSFKRQKKTVNEMEKLDIDRPDVSAYYEQTNCKVSDNRQTYWEQSTRVTRRQVDGWLGHVA